MTMTTERCLLEGCDRLVYARGACSPHYQRFRLQGRLDELGAQLPTLTCGVCGISFQPKRRRQEVSYCSRKCIDAACEERERAKRPPPAPNCLNCGKQLVGKRADTKCCNRQCAGAWNHRRRQEAGIKSPSQPVTNQGSCLECGVSLVGKRPQAKFCSVPCGMRHNNQRYIAERQAERAAAPRPKCQTCSGEVPSGWRLFCSAECRQAGVRPRKYGLTTAGLAAMLEAQGHVCAICRTDQWGPKGSHIDHSHGSGKVRGILCNDCNGALARLHDDPARADAAAAYLRNAAS